MPRYNEATREGITKLYTNVQRSYTLMYNEATREGTTKLYTNVQRSCSMHSAVLGNKYGLKARNEQDGMQS